MTDTNEKDNQENIYALKDTDIGFNDFARFYQALASDDTETVKVLVGRGMDVKGRCDNDENLLHLAVNNNCPKIVGVLIEAGANPDARDGKGDSPLHYAARIGSIESLAALLDSGATVDLPGHGGRTALFEAIRWNELEAVEILLDRGANVHYQIRNARSLSNGEFPIHTAARHASIEIMAALIKAGADVGVQSARGEKAIDEAMRVKNIDLAEFLAKSGAEMPDLINSCRSEDEWAKAEQWYKNVKKADDPESTANHMERLCRAIRQGENEKLRTMIYQRRTQPNAFDKHGYTPFHWAVLEGNIEAMKALLAVNTESGGANPELRTAEGSTTLALSVWRFMNNNKRTKKGLPVEREATLDALRFLLDRDVRIDAVNKIGQSLLHVAAMNDEIEIMAILLNRGAALELREDIGRTPLFYAISLSPQSYETVKFLIERNANVNVRDYLYARTPLHRAALCRAFRIMSALLKAGADRNIEDDKGKTALDYLRKGGQR